MKILNIYGQWAWHTEARIIGNREGLVALRQAIDEVLKGDVITAKQKTGIYASDGEGYEVIIELHDDVWGANINPDNYWNKAKSDPQYLSMILVGRGIQPSMIP